MRLSKIRLSGFKSFVDPTSLTVSNNLIGIVGPNGCGKSNIIDAVTWVMGESSAKHLRGDALTDVIFNGSGTRQPIGQTSVELVFDNTEGKLGGQYASYNEISIKRQMNREGISTYLLNGTRCRRRDIQAIFLGTGLGPRSYAIIEQGVISRLIEAKPDELRTFIEEAAGISKYRERRRETENRIRHTRENIDRLNDIREELDKQLNHLKRQARAAERYQILKQEERQLHLELLALNWKDLNGRAKQDEEKVRKEQTRVEEGMARLRHIEAAIEKHRDELTSANENLNQSQSGFYQIGGEISHLEQKIQHAQEKIRSLETELSKVNESIAAMHTQQGNDRAKLAALAEQAGSLEPRLQGSRSQSDKAYDTLNQAEQAMQSWQAEWDACQEATANFSRQIEVDTTRLEHLQDGLSELDKRRLQLQQELDDFDAEEIKHQLNQVTTALEQKNRLIQQQHTELETRQGDSRRLRNEIHELNENLAVKRSAYQKLEGKIASLEALQQHAAGTEEDTVIEWLKSVNLDQAPRLAQQLSVEDDWTRALETVLGYHLQAICVDDIEASALRLDDLSQAGISLISMKHPPEEHYSPKSYPRLIDKLTSGLSLESLLNDVYIANDVKEALQIRKKLQGSESVVSKDGIWFGANWIRVNKQSEEQTGILTREQQISDLKRESQVLVGEIQELESRLTTASSTLEEAEQILEAFQTELHPEREQQSKLASEHAEIKTRLEQASKRMQQLQEELETLNTQQEIDQQEIEGLKQRLSRTGQDNEKLQTQRGSLSTLRDDHRQSLDRARSQWQVTHEQSHEIALQLESISSQKASLEQAIQRTNIQLANLDARADELNTELKSTRAPVPDFEASLETKLGERVEAEKTLAAARNHVQTIDGNLREKEQERMEAEQNIQEMRDQLETVRLKTEETRVRLQTVAEQLQDSGHQPEEILANMDESAEQATWQERIAQVERKITRLGPINLAAIDEFNQLSERKEYLDKQHEDLSEALTTLQNAIKKIDRETRTRFKETFDELNTNLQEMFPILFGGGHAYLEMTGDDLLETGVTIMARPPGKRNSNIHLLSGGEKALSAVALVFSIFKLNPAPFCILDEVDAPLDDTNVGRFSELVAQMSTDIQFIVVTHNKITMEIAQQLLGVTMQEAGVSRLVSVDMDEAVEMAASA